MSASTEHQPRPLEYSNRPVVGVVTCDRRDGALTLTALRDTSRLVRGAALAAAGVVLLVVTVVMYRWSGGTRPSGMSFVWVAAGAGYMLLSAVADVVAALNPAVIEFDGRRLTLTRRGVYQVNRGEWEREWVVDLRAQRLRFQDTLVRPFALLAVLSNDERVELLRGSRAEVDFAAAELRDAMGLLPERWLEEGYPPPPRWAPVARTISVGGVSLTFRPPSVPWFVLAAAFPAIFAAAWWLQTYVSPDLVPWTSDRWQTGWAVLQTSLISLLGVVALCGVVYKLRSWTSLAVDGERLVWSETGLRPGRAEWPLGEVFGFDLDPRRFGRADLRMVRRDGGVVTLLRSRRRREVEWAAENLRRAAEQAAVASAARAGDDAEC